MNKWIITLEVDRISFCCLGGGIELKEQDEIVNDDWNYSSRMYYDGQ
jgi:general stress protein 26